MAIRTPKGTSPQSGPDTAAQRLAPLPSRGLGEGRRLFTADSRRARMRGLAGLEELPGAWALHLAPCRSVHTFGMRFVLDLVWLDRNGSPVRVDEAVPPQRLRTCLHARSVVEVAAGQGEALARELGGAA